MAMNPMATITIRMLLIASAGSALADPGWVRGEIRLNLRTGASMQNRIVGVISVEKDILCRKSTAKTCNLNLIIASPGGCLGNVSFSDALDRRELKKMLEVQLADGALRAGG